MSYDGLVLRAVTEELNSLLSGARIDKIYQPAKLETIFLLRQGGRNHKLLLTAAAQEARVHLTTQSRKNPSQPPLFCMVLRKHLEGGRILSFTQQGLERILEINFEIINELGDKDCRKIIIEIMGKHSNIILLNSDQIIIDSIHRIPFSISRYRQVLPGLSYISPPPQDKLIPWETTKEIFYDKILSFPISQKLSKVVLQSISGLSPQSVEELLYRAKLDPSLALEFCGEYELNTLWQIISSAAAQVKNGQQQAEVVVVNNNPLTFSALSLTHFFEKQRLAFVSMNDALDYYYQHRQKENVFRQKYLQLTQIIKKEIERCEKKAGLQKQTVEDAQDTQKYRLWGELLTASLHQLTNANEVEVTNYYEENTPLVTIPLDKNLTPLENAQKYFLKYQKAKHAAEQALLQLNETRNELNYLYSLSNSLDNAEYLSELEENEEEIRESGYLKAVQKNPSKNKKADKAFTLPAKILLQNWEIYYGKNNKQNDYLTTKIAKPEDIWLHTKDIPGSHVVIKNPAKNEIQPHILEKAALLAAYYSKARSSSNVPVDYTYKKHVWKVKGAKPGMVHYDNQRTIYITPDEKIVQELLSLSI